MLHIHLNIDIHIQDNRRLIGANLLWILYFYFETYTQNNSEIGPEVVPRISRGSSVLAKKVGCMRLQVYLSLSLDSFGFTREFALITENRREPLFEQWAIRNVIMIKGHLNWRYPRI